MSPLPAPKPAPASPLLGLSPEDFRSLSPPPGLAYRDLFASPSAALSAWAEEKGLRPRALLRLRTETGGQSEKTLFGLADGFAVESVLIRRRDGHTACISSQVGCAFACRFCASGQAGLKRNLSAGEIVEQVVQLGRRVNRVVFMGVGEPLNNYEEVLRAIRILRDREGMRFPTSGITLSTIGIPKALARLREEHLAINLAISLHASSQAVRDRLIPGARRHDIGEVVARARSWGQRHNRRVTFVYLVLPGINDAPEDARRLASLVAGPHSRVNLMRWNPVDGVDLPRTPDSRLKLFRRTLERAGVPVVVRDTQGRDIDAACGQLWLRDLRGRALDPRGRAVA